MPDISMCGDEECPSRTLCYRNEASGTVPSPLRQSYMNFRREPGEDDCDSFMQSHRAVKPAAKKKR